MAATSFFRMVLLLNLPKVGFFSHPVKHFLSTFRNGARREACGIGIQATPVYDEEKI
jgi:hypothetical protein